MTLVEVVTALVALGIGVGGGIGGVAISKRRKSGSSPPGPKASAPDWAEITGRHEMPVCGAHGGFGARLDGMDARHRQSDERYQAMHETLSDVRIDVAELRTEVRMVLGMPPAPVRRGGAAK
jgi:hypothetical protein